MKKTLLFVLAAVLLTAMIFSTATASRGGPNPDGPKLGPCVCEPSVDTDADGICDDCGRPIPHGDGVPDGDGDPDRKRDGSCGD